METLDFIAQKFGVNLDQKSPITIPNVNRKIMARMFAELGFTSGAEIGVAKGEHAQLLCDSNPSMKLYCVDAWESYPGYHDYFGDKLNAFYAEALNRLDGRNAVIIREFSDSAVKQFKDGSLDFVYIDGGHDFKNVAIDICDWTPKVRIGGIVYGHDWKREHRLGKGRLLNAVKDVVGAYINQYKITPWFILGEQGPRDGLYREGTQSWMFVRR